MDEKRFDKLNEVAVRLCEWYAEEDKDENEHGSNARTENKWKSNIDIRSTKFMPTKHDF